MKSNKREANERLQHAVDIAEANRAARVEQVKAKTGRSDLPLEQRKLTQQEAAAFCDVSTATIQVGKSRPKNGPLWPAEAVSD